MLKLLSVLASFILFVWIYRGFMPVLRLRIAPRCIDKTAGRFILGIEVENKSKLAVRKKLARVQILEYGSEIPSFLSEWVPFEEERKRSNEEPLEWRDPVEVLNSTIKIEPGETIYVELLYTCSPNCSVIHCGLQFQVNLNPIASIAYNFGIMTSETWTTTKWVNRTES